jgi:hypothetical protein
LFTIELNVKFNKLWKKFSFYIFQIIKKTEKKKERPARHATSKSFVTKKCMGLHKGITVGGLHITHLCNYVEKNGYKQFTRCTPGRSLKQLKYIDLNIFN